MCYKLVRIRVVPYLCTLKTQIVLSHSPKRRGRLPGACVTGLLERIFTHDAFQKELVHSKPLTCKCHSSLLARLSCNAECADFGGPDVFHFGAGNFLPFDVSPIQALPTYRDSFPMEVCHVGEPLDQVRILVYPDPSHHLCFGWWQVFLQLCRYVQERFPV